MENEEDAGDELQGNGNQRGSPIGRLMQNLVLDRSKIKNNPELIAKIGADLTNLIDLLACSIEQKNNLQTVFTLENHPAVQHSHQIVLYVIQKIAEKGWNLISLSSEGLVFSNSEGKVISINA